jgi:DNA-binding NtrC family response regulator
MDILLVEPDDELAGMIAEHIESALDTKVLRVRTASQAAAAYLASAPTIVISEMELPDSDGLALTREIRAQQDGEASIILMSDQPTVGRAIEAMRLGVRDLFTKPFDLRRLSHVVEQEAHGQRDRQRQLRRNERLRRLARRVMRERRDLRQRIDLICRDLVHAYQRLAKKVAENSLNECRND